VSGFLLDTNVISELIRPKPEPKVTKWIDAIDEELLFLSVLTLGEIRKDRRSFYISERVDRSKSTECASFLESPV
jgi:hypothetical protein